MTIGQKPKIHSLYCNIHKKILNKISCNTKKKVHINELHIRET